MTKTPDEIYGRIEFARKLAEKLEYKVEHSYSISGIEAGLASYLLSSSFEHIAYWTERKFSNRAPDENKHSRISFGNVYSEAKVRRYAQWIDQPCQSRLMTICKLIKMNKMANWINTTVNQDKHQFTLIHADWNSLNFTQEKLLEISNFLVESIEYICDGVSVPPEFVERAGFSDEMGDQLDFNLLVVLVHERIAYAEELIRALEKEVCVHLRARRKSAKITKKTSPNGGLGWEVFGEDKCIPIEWRIRAGLIGHLLRSTLDHMVWALVVRNGETPTSKNKFPIPESNYDFNRQSGRRDLKREQMLKNLPDDDKKKLNLCCTRRTI